MTKLKTPFLSLGARGTLGSFLTTSRHPSGTVAKRIPTHPDAQTLPQLYQRWRFYDANQYWNSLTQTQRNVYRDLKHPPRMTAHQRCIRAYLIDPLDQVLWLHLDIMNQPTTPDSSRKGNHPTRFGVSPTTGPINGAALFDGNDDELVAPNVPTLQNFTQKSVLFWASRGTLTGQWNYLYHAGYIAAPYGDALQAHVTNPTARWFLRDPAGAAAWQEFPLPHSQWHHYALTWDGTTAIIYVDASPQAPFAFAGPLACSGTAMVIGRSPGSGYWWRGLLDDFRIYTRSLTPAHITYIYSQERYPKAS